MKELSLLAFGKLCARLDCHPRGRHPYLLLIADLIYPFSDLIYPLAPMDIINPMDVPIIIE